MRILLLFLLLSPATSAVPDPIQPWQLLGEPSKVCTPSYEVEDNDCEIVVLRKPRIIPAPKQYRKR